MNKQATASSETDIHWKDSWIVAKGEYDGNTLVVRINEGAQVLAGDKRYSHQVGIAVPLRNPDPYGLPTNEELAQLGDIEDIVCTALEENHTSVMVLVITTGGMREFAFYTTDPSGVTTAFEIFGPTIQSHDLQLMIQPDPDWSVYCQFLDGLVGPSADAMPN